ncbi:MAG: hypothetical protein MUC96_31615 [Myxococcaceae bacterium]|jgi:hypothetical protein|nr:hypothetical protein [Myxococcaceae bacterium]
MLRPDEPDQPLDPDAPPPTSAPKAPTRRRVAHLLHRLLDDELELYLATRSLEATALEALAFGEARSLGQQAWHLDQMLAALVFQLRRDELRPHRHVAEALLASDLALVFHGLPVLPADEGLSQAVRLRHTELRHRLLVLSAIFSGSRRLALANLFRRLALRHACLALEDPPAGASPALARS